MPLKNRNDANESIRPASSSEINSWKRGFTPQAEIWNGRMAIAGLVIVLVTLLLSNIIFSDTVSWLSFCLFSECKSYRWILKRELLSGKRTVVFIGLNPSKANSHSDDRTLLRIINFCSRWNYKNIYVINLFGLISQYPIQLSKSSDPIGKNNDLITLKSLEFWKEDSNCDLWLGWGDKGQLKGRDRKILKLIKNFVNLKSNENNSSKRVLSLGISKKGNPRHPLYMSNHSSLRKFDI